MTIIRLMCAVWLILNSIALWAEAYVPKSDLEILERVLVTSAEKQRLQTLRSENNKHPADYSRAIELATDYIALGRTRSDPRYYGYAESVLETWLKPPSSRADALVLKATILQNRHDFDAALVNLNSALKLNPRLSQAWLTQAAVYEVRGDYRAAINSCLAVARYANQLTSATCINSALSLSGQAQSSYRQLAATVGNQGSPEELTWAYTVLAELAERLRLSKEAESWYHLAINQHYRSVYLLSSYADFLLDQQRPDAVINLLKGETQADALLLRLTLAEQMLQSEGFSGHVNQIKDRVAAAHARGDKVHQGDEARFNLHILKDAKKALALAVNNWVVQKEPRDARILLEAAIAAKQPEAAQPVLRFMEQTRLEDNRLLPLLKLAKG